MNTLEENPQKNKDFAIEVQTKSRPKLSALNTMHQK
jgi:hypothetical protein